MTFTAIVWSLFVVGSVRRLEEAFERSFCRQFTCILGVFVFSIYNCAIDLQQISCYIRFCCNCFVKKICFVWQWFWFTLFTLISNNNMKRGIQKAVISSENVYSFQHISEFHYSIVLVFVKNNTNFENSFQNKLTTIYTICHSEWYIK